MMVPFLPEVITVMVDVIKKKCVQQPEMGWILQVQVVQMFKSCEKGLSSMNKLRADFDPKPLDMGIVSRAVAMTFNKQLIMLSCAGTPYSLMASKKSCRMVDALLLELAWGAST